MCSQGHRTTKHTGLHARYNSHSHPVPTAEGQDPCACFPTPRMVTTHREWRCAWNGWLCEPLLCEHRWHVCEAGSLPSPEVGPREGSALLWDSCLGCKCCQQPAPCWGRATCQAAAAARGRGTLFIREIRQLMRDGPQSSCSLAAAGTDAGGGEGRGRGGKPIPR